MSEPTKRVHNFNAGPAALPLSVLQHAQSELLNYNNTGMSIMEISHRSKPFESLLEQCTQSIKSLYSIPDNYSVLYMQGGGTAQFSAIPLNLLGSDSSDTTVDYIVTGTWSQLASQEAAKYATNVNIVTTNKSNNHTDIPSMDTWRFSTNAKYIYYCHNETVNGVEFSDTPQIPQQYAHIPLVCDMSSCFMSRPIDVSRYALIYAGVQKNIGPAGVTVVIIRNDLLNRSMKICPTILNYTILAKANSLYNTPPVYNIYITALVLQWLQQQGGLTQIATINDEKSTLLYNYIDQSKLYKANVNKPCRSHMNVNFDIVHTTDHDKNLKQLIQEAEQQHIIGIAGHRSVGGLRASLYNAVSIDSVKALIQFLQQFEQKHSQ